MSIMKKYVFLLLLFAFFFNVNAQRIINNPIVEKTVHTNAKISKIEMTENYVIVHLLVPSSTNKQATFRISSGTLLLPSKNGYSLVSESVRYIFDNMEHRMILDLSDLEDYRKLYYLNQKNPYASEALLYDMRQCIDYSIKSRNLLKKEGLLIVSAGDEKLDTEYKIYSNTPTNWHFTMYFNKSGIHSESDKIGMFEMRSGSHDSESKGWTGIEFSMPCPYNPIQSLFTNEEVIRKEIDDTYDGIVGIYENSGNLRVAVIKEDDSYAVVYIKGVDNNCWKCGYLKGVLRSTATNGLLKGSVWFKTDFSKSSSILASFDGASMDLLIDGERSLFVKMYPNSSKSGILPNDAQWSGTGYAISSNYIVTNEHVIDGAKTIKIKGINGNFSTSYSAEVVSRDKKNDLAILKINDSRFGSITAIPYAIKTQQLEVGDEVYVLGYPLTQALGDEIKLTNGIISSRTGYQNDISTYQISAPVQPGNSGGPMFDSKGNVVGIINAGVPGAENVGYAIKTSYLKNLIESAELHIALPSNNTISSLSLSEKVKRVKKYVYFIECSSGGIMTSSSNTQNGSSSTWGHGNSSQGRNSTVITQESGNSIIIPESSNVQITTNSGLTFIVTKIDLSDSYTRIHKKLITNRTGISIWNTGHEYIEDANSGEKYTILNSSIGIYPRTTSIGNKKIYEFVETYMPLEPTTKYIYISSGDSYYSKDKIDITIKK